MTKFRVSELRVSSFRLSDIQTLHTLKIKVGKGGMKVECEAGNLCLRRAGEIRNSSPGEKIHLGNLFIRILALFRISIFEFLIFE
jgi:hypothetical protein